MHFTSSEPRLYKCNVCSANILITKLALRKSGEYIRYPIILSDYYHDRDKGFYHYIVYII